MVASRQGWREGTVREFGINMHTLLYFKLVTNKDPTAEHTELYSTLYGAWMGGEFGVEWIHVYVTG